MTETTPDRRNRTSEEVKRDLERGLTQKGVAGTGSRSSIKESDASWLDKNASKIPLNKGPRAR